MTHMIRCNIISGLDTLFLIGGNSSPWVLKCILPSLNLDEAITVSITKVPPFEINEPRSGLSTKECGSLKVANM